MAYTKKYCLRCERGSNCICLDSSKQFYHSHKLRVPPTKNKVVFRKFLIECPSFVNLVPEELHEDFRNLLRKVKFTEGIINGKDWTKI